MKNRPHLHSLIKKFEPRSFFLMTLFVFISACGGTNDSTTPEQNAGRETIDQEDTGQTLVTRVPDTNPDPTSNSNTAPETPTNPIPAPKNLGDIVPVIISNQTDAEKLNIPITFGHVFKKTDIPSGRFIGVRLEDGTEMPLQVDAKAMHRDGSLRHAVLSLILPRLGTSAQEKLMLFSTDIASETGSVVSKNDLLKNGFQADIDLDESGTVYSASVKEQLLSGEHQVWLQGSVAGEFMVSTAFRDVDGNEHPHLTAQFHVRAYAKSSNVRVSVVVENNWSYVANPQNVTYDLSVKIGGALVYAKKELEHYHHARWQKVFWSEGAPNIHVKHNAGYLMASKAVSNYDPSLVITESDLESMDLSWKGKKTEPMGVGTYDPYMPSTGGRSEIGPLPSHAVKYLISMDSRAKKIALGHARLAGSWSIHYRDKKTDLPTTVDDYPYMTLDGNYGDTKNPATGQYEAFPDCGKTCSTPYSPDTAHQPSMAYLPYLVTGDYYYLEELQFWANYNILKMNAYYRLFEKGLLNRNQVRGQAWGLRTLSRAAYITPDAHPLKNYFEGLIQSNIKDYENKYLKSAATNSLGINTDGYALAYNDGRGIAPWQDDFFTWSLGHLIDLGYTEADSFFQWKSQFATDRMVGEGFCWIFGALYSFNVRDDTASPIYSTIKEAYEANVNDGGNACGSQALADFKGLQLGEMPGYAHSTTGYPANMQPALAVIADHGPTKGDEAWRVFDARAIRPNYTEEPQFAVVPR